MKLKRKSLIHKFDNVGAFGTIYVRKRTISDAASLANMLVDARKKYNGVPTDLFIAATILSCLVDKDGNYVAFETEDGEFIEDPIVKMEALVSSYESKALDLLYSKVVEVNPLATQENVEKKKEKS